MSGFKESLQAQLALAGPPTITMLQGLVDLDADTIVAAVEAAGLLDAVTAGEQATLRQHVLDAVTNSALDWSLILVEPTPAAWLADHDTALEHVSLAAGLAHCLAAPWKTKLEQALARVALDAEMYPERFVALSGLAETLLDALDLDEDHPITAPLRNLSEAKEAAKYTISEQTLQRAVQSARATLFPSLLTRWGERLRDGGTELVAMIEQALAAPALGLAAGIENTDRPRNRCNLFARNDQEVNLVFMDETLLVEWFSESAPPPISARLEPGGVVLKPSTPLEENSLCWVLSEPPEVGSEIHVVLTGPAGVLEVRLADA